MSNDLTHKCIIYVMSCQIYILLGPEHLPCERNETSRRFVLPHSATFNFPAEYSTQVKLCLAHAACFSFPTASVLLDIGNLALIKALD